MIESDAINREPSATVTTKVIIKVTFTVVVFEGITDGTSPGFLFPYNCAAGGRHGKPSHETFA